MAGAETDIPAAPTRAQSFTTVNLAGSQQQLCLFLCLVADKFEYTSGDERQDMQDCLKFDVRFIDLGLFFHVLINPENTSG